MIVDTRFRGGSSSHGNVRKPGTVDRNVRIGRATGGSRSRPGLYRGQPVRSGTEHGFRDPSETGLRVRGHPVQRRSLRSGSGATRAEHFAVHSTGSNGPTAGRHHVRSIFVRQQRRSVRSRSRHLRYHHQIQSPNWNGFYGLNTFLFQAQFRNARFLFVQKKN